MVIHKQICGTVITKGKLDIFIPLTVANSNWKHWGGDPARLLLSMLLTRCLPEAFIEMTMDICRMRQAEFGLRQI